MIPTQLRRHTPRALPSLLCSAFLAAQALAQPSPPVPRPDPLDPTATVPAVPYDSATAEYRPLGNEKTVSWREANDAVARIGGWRVYAREAQQAELPASMTPPAAMPPGGMPADMTHQPMPAGHDGHRKP